MCAGDWSRALSHSQAAHAALPGDLVEGEFLMLFSDHHIDCFFFFLSDLHGSNHIIHGEGILLFLRCLATARYTEVWVCGETPEAVALRHRMSCGWMKNPPGQWVECYDKHN